MDSGSSGFGSIYRRVRLTTAQASGDALTLLRHKKEPFSNGSRYPFVSKVSTSAKQDYGSSLPNGLLTSIFTMGTFWADSNLSSQLEPVGNLTINWVGSRRSSFPINARNSHSEVPISRDNILLAQDVGSDSSLKVLLYALLNLLQGRRDIQDTLLLVKMYRRASICRQQ